MCEVIFFSANRTNMEMSLIVPTFHKVMLILTASVAMTLSAQTTESNQSTQGPAKPATTQPVSGAELLAQAQQGSSEHPRTYTLHVTSQEVVVEVIAKDKSHHPITNLKPDELTIFEVVGTKKEQRQTTAFRFVDPDVEGDRDRPALGYLLPLGGRCERRVTPFYKMSFHPQDTSPGFHSLIATTTRKGATLSFRNRYYIGDKDVKGAIKPQERDTQAKLLALSACFHMDRPASLQLSANLLGTTKAGSSRYRLTLEPRSLPYASIRDDSTQTMLDVGFCGFDKSGKVVGTWHGAADRHLPPADREAMSEKGVASYFDVPEMANLAAVRFLMRDPETGNFGSVEVITPVEASSLEQEEAALNESKAFERTNYKNFGSMIPRSYAMCGDVYELSPNTRLIPADLDKRDAVGALYTDAFDVQNTQLDVGPPGSTARIEWFGIDYYGEFWVTHPGVYKFFLTSDDGADLLIDDQEIINNDGIHPFTLASGSITLAEGKHRLHLPYFQGPARVQLMLEVLPPAGTRQLFDVRNFGKPASMK